MLGIFSGEGIKWIFENKKKIIRRANYLQVQMLKKGIPHHTCRSVKIYSQVNSVGEIFLNVNIARKSFLALLGRIKAFEMQWSFLPVRFNLFFGAKTSRFAGKDPLNVSNP